MDSTKESVHLEDYPVVNKGLLDEKLLLDMIMVRDICSIGLNIRDEKRLKVRQPLSKVYVPVENPELIEIIKGELNVKEVLFAKEAVEGESLESQKSKHLWVTLDTSITPELKEEGLLNEIVRGLQVARKESNCKVGEMIEIGYQSESKELVEIIEKNEESLSKLLFAKTLKRESALQEPLKIKVDNEILEVQITK